MALSFHFGGQSRRNSYIQAPIDRVDIGDKSNIEAQAAREYWQKLMDDDFRRGGNCIINAALNYGYAVIRAYVARAQVSYGLIPAFGIHHNAELNAFNLTDDMLEVFRPFIDREVFQMRGEGFFNEGKKLTKEERQRLAGVGTLSCKIEGQIHTLANACEKLSAGLVSAIEKRSTALMPLPEMELKS